MGANFRKARYFKWRRLCQFIVWLTLHWYQNKTILSRSRTSLIVKPSAYSRTNIRSQDTEDECYRYTLLNILIILSLTMTERLQGMWNSSWLFSIVCRIVCPRLHKLRLFSLTIFLTVLIRSIEWPLRAFASMRAQRFSVRARALIKVIKVSLASSENSAINYLDQKPSIRARANENPLN